MIDDVTKIKLETELRHASRCNDLSTIKSLNLKGTATLMITMFYMKDLNKP